MKLLLGDEAFTMREQVARQELSPLAQALAAELQQVESRELYVPKEKALLSRAGGRCERDGSNLEFDPFSPNRHRCPSCGTIHVGELHHRFWVFWYQLWLAERAVHGALLGRLLCDSRASALSATILERYADAYLLYPNRDNVLGPTRVFFSTYLESIWLLNLCIALDLLESGGGHSALGARVREQIVEPSAALIASYDEGASNRQVWNDAALLAAARLLGRDADAEHLVFHGSGLVYHLEHGLLGDGTWYEGENYHLFAHRGLWYGVTMAEHAGIELPPEAVRRFREGFATPFLTALPDMTLPSRRDSQYAISLRQPRFAELCELGLGREPGDGDPRLRAMLRHLYEDPFPRRQTGRTNSTADVERNLPGTSLTRADLGWRSLLFARAELPPLTAAPLGSALLEAQGIAVFRRENERVYCALDYGTSGGGHGHPDRLNVLLSDGDARWLDDMGTGSYVDPSLHWYRSTLAHNAPLFNGYEQRRVDGELLAFEEGTDLGWVSARAAGLFPGVTAMRSLIAMKDYALDQLVWRSDEVLVMDLPIHVEPAELRIVRAPLVPIRPGMANPFEPLEDTLGVLSDTSGQVLPAGGLAQVHAHDAGRTLNIFITASFDAVLYRAMAPGPPGSRRRRFLVLRVVTPGGAHTVRTVYDWTGGIEDVRVDLRKEITTVERHGGARDRHRLLVDGWHVAREADSGRQSTVLTGFRSAKALPASPRDTERAPDAVVMSEGSPRVFTLGQESYRRSEQSWDEASRPSAQVSVLLIGTELVLDIIVNKSGELTFAGADAVNPYDNEAPDINGDGVQVYLADESAASAWVLVGEGDGANEEGAPVRARIIDGWDSPRSLRGVWRRHSHGYHMRVRMDFPLVANRSREFSLGVVVNEKPERRERRRGQLVLGGAVREFVYLRGDRESRDRLLRFQVVP